MYKYKYSEVTAIRTQDDMLCIEYVSGVFLFPSFVKGTFSRNGSHFIVCSKELPLFVHRDFIVSDNVNLSAPLVSLYASTLAMAEDDYPDYGLYTWERDILLGDDGPSYYLSARESQFEELDSSQ
jgi:hypothetical protein